MFQALQDMGMKQINHNVNSDKIRFHVYSVPSKLTNKTVIIRFIFKRVITLIKWHLKLNTVMPC